MSQDDQLEGTLRASPKSWLVTGAAGFIGSNLVEALLKLDQKVVGFDNFSTGYLKNLQEVQQIVGPKRWTNFKLIENDTRDGAACQSACAGIDYVLHQAALGSVPRSMADPIASHESNVTGFLNMLVAARDQKAKRLVYASSSAIYGDHPGLPKVEDKTGNLLSPYAATKLINEVYAGTFATAYEFKSIGLRYFNVFGPRQDPDGAYAAVIPKWIAALIKQEPVTINGDGETSRDFCFVDNVVQANLLAATATNRESVNQAYNIAISERTTLNELFDLLQTSLRKLDAKLPLQKPKYQDFRAGDVRHSLADISKARKLLGYEPKYQIADGINIALDWYLKNVV